MLHVIAEDSPLHGATEESLRAQDGELIVAVMGIDGTSSQTVHGRYSYDDQTIRFGSVRYSTPKAYVGSEFDFPLPPDAGPGWIVRTRVDRVLGHGPWTS